MNKCNWTAEEDEFLRLHTEDMTVQELSQALNRSLIAIRKRIYYQRDAEKNKERPKSEYSYRTENRKLCRQIINTVRKEKGMPLLPKEQEQ